MNHFVRAGLSSAALLFGPSSALRASRRGASARPTRGHWQDLADGFRLPTEEDQADINKAKASSEYTDFDWRAWGDEFEAKTFTQQVDHTNAYHQQLEYLNSDTKTFEQRYWINTKAWAGAESKAPIFVIISPYGGFNTFAYGTVGELAREVGALVVQIEGRFAPDSLPFNESGFDKSPNRIGLASAENAMRDYVMLISHLRDVYDPEWVCPTATFGVSLAGMYAAWLRYKFPLIIDMALASGSPMTGYPGTSDTFAFARIITEAWADSSGDAECVDLVRDSFKALEGDSCTDSLYGMIYNEATYRAYPPRGRTAAACQRARAKREAGGSPREVALELCGDQCVGDCTPEPSEPSMWSYLSCTQVVNPIGNNGVSDFFWPAEPWDTETRRSDCMDTWGIEPQREGDYHAELFGFHHLSQMADNMKRTIFTFGTYDAWTGFALSLEDISPDLPVVVAKGGCHGSDMIGSRSEDTADIVAARQRETSILKRWIEEVQQRPVKLQKHA